jgi:hypothetical protein
VLPDKVDISVIEDVLKLNKSTMAELSKVEQYSFNIFIVREQTNENELVALMSYLWAKENILENLPIDKQKLLPMLTELQGGYFDITYHNKTHAADLVSTFYYFARSCGLY